MRLSSYKRSSKCLLKQVGNYRNKMLQVALLLLALPLMGYCQEQTSCSSCSTKVAVLTKEEIGEEIREQLNYILRTGITVEANCPQLNTDNITAMIQETVANEVFDVLEQYLNPILNKLQYLRRPGVTASHPAFSCKEVQDYDSNSTSGYYWIEASDGSAVSMYCNMTLTCGGVTGGWTRIAQLDMRESGSQCPPGLRTRSNLPIRLCGINSNNAACSSVVYPSNGIQYTQVCGRIIAFQDRTPDAFGGDFLVARNGRTLTIDDNYVDGISLTHGSNPREHIWTLAAAVDEVSSFPNHNCPCTNTNVNIPSPPSFVGNNYFCDTANRRQYNFIFFPDDPLWDGAGCGPLNTCCSLNNPPWFNRQLNAATTDDIEMRLCRDQAVSDEDIPIQQIELYIQ